MGKRSVNCASARNCDTSLARQFERGTLRDPALTGIAITVTEVRVSPDLKHATAFMMPLGGAKLAEVLAGLTRSAGYLRREMAKEVPLRHRAGAEYLRATRASIKQAASTNYCDGPKVRARP